MELGSWLDNTEAQLFSEQLSHQANHDSLTELPNLPRVRAEVTAQALNAVPRRMSSTPCSTSIWTSSRSSTTPAGTWRRRPAAPARASRVGRGAPTGHVWRGWGRRIGVPAGVLFAARRHAAGQPAGGAVSDFRFAWATRRSTWGDRRGGDHRRQREFRCAQRRRQRLLCRQGTLVATARTSIPNDIELFRRQGEMSWWRASTKRWKRELLPTRLSTDRARAGSKVITTNHCCAWRMKRSTGAAG